MPQADRSHKRAQSLGEEIANSISHGAGLLVVVAAAPFLIVDAARQDGATVVIGAGIFAFTLILLYLTSVLYHTFPPNRAKRVFRVLDHSAIFLLIAGTYTPFTLGILRGAWGWTLLGLIWGLALAGIILNAVSVLRYPWISLILYLVMGWLVLIAIRPLLLLMPSKGFFWLLSGGIAYTAGILFYTAKRVRYSHFVWHLFVIAGTACHFIAIAYYAV